MALYDGFFDAVIDESGEFDRAYGSAQFVDYFRNIVGSGVCIAENPDSMKVTYEDGNAVIAPGYLFINGYWLKNDDSYSVPVSSAESDYAVLARLNLATRRIELLLADWTGNSYSNALVLARINSGAVTDTRRDSALCGIIDSPVSVGEKAIFADNYINEHLGGKIAEVEQMVSDKSVLLDRAIANVNAKSAEISLPIGEIRFGMKAPSENWLPCDGRYVYSDDYPELVEALKARSFGPQWIQMMYGGSKGELISNCYVYAGHSYLYLVSSEVLVHCAGGMVQFIGVTGVDALSKKSNVSTVLSICGGSLYLTQSQNKGKNIILLECADFDINATQISMTDLSALYKAKMESPDRVKWHSMGSYSDGGKYTEEDYYKDMTSYGAYFPMYVGVKYNRLNYLYYYDLHRDWFIPEVVDINGIKYLATSMWKKVLVIPPNSESENMDAKTFHLSGATLYLSYCKWEAGSFSNAETTYVTKTGVFLSNDTEIFSSEGYQTDVDGMEEYDNIPTSVPASVREAKVLKLIKTLIGFSHKNDFNLLAGRGSVALVADNSLLADNLATVYGVSLWPYSFPDVDDDFVFSNTTSVEIGRNIVSFGYPPGNDKELAEAREFEAYQLQDFGFTIIPVMGGDQILYTASIAENCLRIKYIGYGDNQHTQKILEIDITLPDLAKLFTDSVVYAKDLEMWFVFVGTGILYSRRLDTGWMYYNTIGDLGAIRSSGSLDYDEDRSKLYISGIASDGMPKMMVMDLDNSLAFSDGSMARLPIASAGGANAYIKAK